MTLLHHKPPVENMITGQLMTGDIIDETLLLAWSRWIAPLFCQNRLEA